MKIQTKKIARFLLFINITRDLFTLKFNQMKVTSNFKISEFLGR